MTCAVTFGRPSNGSSLAKRIHVETGRIVRRDPSPQTAWCRWREESFTDLHGLMSLVEDAAGRGEFAVRGKPKASPSRRAIYDDPKAGPAGLEVVPRTWGALDFDRMPCDPAHDPLRQPEIGAELCIAHLPPAFRGISYGVQVSASAGFAPGQWRLRLWFTLNKPATGEELREWLKPRIDRGVVDRATLVDAQMIYLGVRTVGDPDPCPRRFFTVPKARDVVVVPDISAIVARRAAHHHKLTTGSDGTVTRLTTPGPIGAWAGSDGDWRLGEHPIVEEAVADCIARVRRDPGAFEAERSRAGSFAAMYSIPWDRISNALWRARGEAKIDASIETLRRAPDGSKHPTYVSELARCKAFCDQYGIPWNPVADTLQQTYEASLPAGEAERRRRGSIEGARQWVEARG